MMAVDHEFFGAEPEQPGLLVEPRGVLDELVPARGRLDIDLDDAGVGVMLKLLSRGSRGGG